MAARSPYLRLKRELRAALVGGLPSEEDHNILNWYASTSLFGVVDGSMWVFLPVFLARLGASPAVVGLHTSLPALLAMACAIPTGMLVDRAANQMAAWKRIAFCMRMFYPLVILAPFFVPRDVLPIFIVWSGRCARSPTRQGPHCGPPLPAAPSRRRGEGTSTARAGRCSA
ncbi:MAG TPA: hypothetical protein PLG21_01465 [Anaerolineae bacterium]|nr:hypothetical protein [Anaerolineae bacterium]